MALPKSITAVCGWAIPPDWLADQVRWHFPGTSVRAVYPQYPADPDEARRLLQEPVSEAYIGYSLGGLWLLHHRHLLPAPAVRAVLAPFLAFPKEAGRGGKVALRQLQYLMRDLTRTSNLPALLAEFLQWGAVPLPESARGGIPSREILLRGLQFLVNISVPDTATENFVVILGENDPFVDAQELLRRVPHGEPVPGAGHAPEALLQYLRGHPALTGGGPGV